MTIIAMTTFAFGAPAEKPKTPIAKPKAPPKQVVVPLSPAQKKLHAALEKALDEADKDNYTLIESLLKKGAPVNVPTTDGATFLMMASLHNAKTTALLLKYRADVKARDKDGWTALHIASLMGDDPKVMELLIAAGAEVNLRIKGDDTPLMLACSVEPIPAVMRALIAAGANVNVRGKDGTPLLVKVAMMNQVEAVEVLVAAKADVNARDKEGNSAMQVASTLPTMASAAARAENRKLTAEEEAYRLRAQRIIEILKQAGAK